MGALILAALLVGLVLLLVTSGTAWTVGVVLVSVSALSLVASGLTIRAGAFGLMTMGRADTRPFDSGGDPAPEYIAEAGIPSEEVWRREEERYRNREHDGGRTGEPDERRPPDHDERQPPDHGPSA